jgi:hypothetical protein
MLSTVTATEALFRHDSENRAHETAILRSIRDHRDAPIVAPTRSRDVARRKVAWPRPIGVRLDLASDSALCASA